MEGEHQGVDQQPGRHATSQGLDGWLGPNEVVWFQRHTDLLARLAARGGEDVGVASLAASSRQTDVSGPGVEGMLCAFDQEQT